MRQSRSSPPLTLLAFPRGEHPFSRADSEGKFVAYYGKNVERDALAAAIEGHINNYRSSHGGKK